MKSISLIVCFLGLMVGAQAQENAARQLAIEIDPAPFVLEGYSFSVKYSPEDAPKTAFMASVYQSNFLDGMMKKSNRDAGWTDMKIRPSYALFSEFYFNEERKGVYFGPAVFLYNKSARLNGFDERAAFSSIYPNMRIGYIWYPFKKLDLYVNPWFNLGSEISLDDKNQLQGVYFEPNRLQYILALHIGYSFKFKPSNDRQP